MSISAFEFGGEGLPLHFLHANGYPPACYQPLLERLASQYHVFGMLLRPLWENSNPDGIRDWLPFTTDLLRFLSDRQAGPVIGVGHSIGGMVTLRAALREPEHFRALVLLDPVLFPPDFILGWNLIRLVGLGHRLHPLIPLALKRRREFNDLETVFRGYRSRPIFRYFSDENLKAYIKGITQPRAEGGYRLVFPPEWEAHIYYTGVWRDLDVWRDLPRLQVPTLILRGAETDTFLERTARLVKRRQPKVRIETLERATHLVPLERPEEVFELIQSFVKEIS
ncbi:MAG: alpha/beta fold hydrolase [Anaerolineae bacterium]